MLQKELAIVRGNSNYLGGICGENYSILDEGKQLEVALTATSGADNAFTVSNGKTGLLTYEVKVGETLISVGGTVLTVNPTTAPTGSATLNFSTPTNTIVYAGDYSGTVTFTVSVR